MVLAVMLIILAGCTSIPEDQCQRPQLQSWQQDQAYHGANGSERCRRDKAGE